MFSAVQLRALRALVNRIIPADDFPAGWEGGVEGYLLRQLAGDLQVLLPVYMSGLNELDREAQAFGELDFADLPAAEQDALLVQIEQGRTLVPWEIDAAAFFQLAVQHAAEGYYSDPGNGGNLGAVSWQMIGFEVRDASL